VGYQLAQVGDLISVGATFGSSAGVSKALDLSLRLKRLDKGRVFVSVSKVDTTGTSASLGAHVGVDAKLKQSVPDLGGGLYQKGGELVAGAVDKQLEKWLSLDFRATHTTSKAESEVTNYVIDLNTTAGAAAYEDLLKLDFRKVDQLSAEGDLSVRQAKLSERTRTEGRELEGKFGPITLLRSVSSSTESHGHLSSSRGDITFDRATLADSYSGILSNLWEGKRSISRELVATQEAGAPQPTYYYHVRHRIEGDGNTSKADVRRFLEFADMVGALDGDTKALASQDKFLESFGDSHRTVDVYLTDGALKSVASAPADTLMRAYAAAYERLDRPWDTNYLFGNDKTWEDHALAGHRSPQARQADEPAGGRAAAEQLGSWWCAQRPQRRRVPIHHRPRAALRRGGVQGLQGPGEAGAGDGAAARRLGAYPPPRPARQGAGPGLLERPGGAGASRGRQGGAGRRAVDQRPRRQEGPRAEARGRHPGPAHRDHGAGSTRPTDAPPRLPCG
jgi:hypothetical protein